MRRWECGPEEDVRKRHNLAGWGWGWCADYREMWEGRLDLIAMQSYVRALDEERVKLKARLREQGLPPCMTMRLSMTAIVLSGCGRKRGLRLTYPAFEAALPDASRMLEESVRAAVLNPVDPAPPSSAPSSRP